MAKKKKEDSTLKEEVKGLLTKKEFVLHCIDITSSTAYFNQLNNIILEHLISFPEGMEIDEKERKNFVETFRQHFDEIRKLRMLYDNLRNLES